MRSLLRSTTALACCIAFSMSVSAQNTSPDPTELFRKLDADGDGKLTSVEVGAERERFFKRLLRTGDRFDELDTNKDGQLEPREVFTGRGGERPSRD